MSVKTAWSVTISCEGRSHTCPQAARTVVQAPLRISTSKARAAGWVVDNAVLRPGFAAKAAPLRSDAA